MKKEYLLLILILIFGAFLRVYNLGDAPFWIDESISSIVAKNILEKGVPLLDSGMMYKGAYVFHYLQAFFLSFGLNDFNARIISVIFGLLTILLGYFIGREYSKSGGIITALFMSVFYLEVFYSRQARFYQMFQFMFFLSLYLLYKSKGNLRYLVLSLITLFITVNIHISGLFLIPFFVLHILIYNKEKYLAVIPVIPYIKRFFNVSSLKSESSEIVVNYFNSYVSFIRNIKYLFILFIPGVIISFYKKKRLSFLLIIPAIVLLISVMFVEYFALRYAYFFVFPLVLYSSLFISYLYERYKNLMIIPILILLIFPSNLVFPLSYVNVIKPIDYNYNDYTAPEINYKDIPNELIEKIKNDKLTVLFSPGAEWYIKKPDYAYPYSMTGIGNDSVSYNNLDRYTGANISTNINKGYFIVDNFAYSKLKSKIDFSNCNLEYENKDLKIYYC